MTTASAATCSSALTARNPKPFRGQDSPGRRPGVAVRAAADQVSCSQADMTPKGRIAPRSLALRLPELPKRREIPGRSDQRPKRCDSDRWALDRPERCGRRRVTTSVGLLTSELERPAFSSLGDPGGSRPTMARWRRSNGRSVTAAGPFRSRTGFPVREVGRGRSSPPTFRRKSR
jgi:hypothetical protein